MLQNHWPMGFLAVVFQILRAVSTAAALLLFLSGSALGEAPWRPGLAALEDKAGTLTFAQIRATKPAFKPLNDTALRAGYTASAWWLRFAIPAGRVDAGPLIVEMGTPNIDRIDFYAVSAVGEVRHYRSGDRLPFAARPIAKRLLLFPIPETWRGPVTVFARVEGQSPLSVPVKVWRAAEFGEAWSGLQVFIGLLFGVLSFALFYNFFVFLSLRDRAYGCYVIYLAATIALHLSLLGLSAQFVWPAGGWQSNIGPLLTFGLVVIAGALYISAFLSLSARQPLLAKLFWGVQGATVLVLALAAFTSIRTGAQLLVPLALFLLSIQFVAIVRANLRGFRPARYLLVPVFVMVPAYAVAILAITGELPFNFFTEHAARFGAMFEAVVLSFALADRFNVIRQESQEAEKRLAAQRQQFAARLVDTQEAERRRIAADLHDTVAQNLLVIGNRLKKLGSTPESDREALSKLGAYSRETLDEVRAISHDLHPSQLDRLGLAATLRAMVKTALKDSGQQWRCEVDIPDDALSPASGIHLYRALQSALGNALRHSRATQTNVSIRVMNGAVTASISDNGRGFDAQEASEGLGFTAMRDRMAVVDGKLEINTDPAKGTTVRFVVPIRSGK